MQEVNDELMTPGCPQCAVKHLSAALAIVADTRKDWVPGHPYAHEVYAARAYVNMVEARRGYASHAVFAAGLLVRAEELATQINADAIADVYRNVRLALDARGDADPIDTLGATLTPSALLFAHVDEAKRELPAVQPYGWDGSREECADWLLRAIATIHEDFYCDTTGGK